MKRLYALAMSARYRDGTPDYQCRYALGATVAESEAEALGLALLESQQTFTAVDGYSANGAVVREIPLELLVQVEGVEVRQVIPVTVRAMTQEEIEITAPMWFRLNTPTHCAECGNALEQAPYRAGDNHVDRAAGRPWHFFTWWCGSCHLETYVRY